MTRTSSDYEATVHPSEEHTVTDADVQLTAPTMGGAATADCLPEQLRAAIHAANLNIDHVVEVINRTLDEDLSWGPDVTTLATLPAGASGTADVVSRQSGCLAGVPVGAAVFYLLAARLGVDVNVELHRADGDRVVPSDRVLTASGPLSCLLTAERTMLNLLGQLSGVATATAVWADALAAHPTSDGHVARIRDTRKTVPGLRVLQKYAVRCGGGVNHRMGVGDAALIKDNHIAAAGSVRAAFESVRRLAPQVSVEVECDTLDQVREAVDADVELILLDNMTPDQMREAVAICRPRGVRTEASGGLTIADAPTVGPTGVDFVSVGALTHSTVVLDLGFDLRLDD